MREKPALNSKRWWLIFFFIPFGCWWDFNKGKDEWRDPYVMVTSQSVCQKMCPSALKHVGSFLPQTLNCKLPGNKEPCIHIPSRASFLKENK